MSHLGRRYLQIAPQKARQLEEIVMTASETPPETAEENLAFSTDYEMGQDNIRPMGLDIHNPVFLISSIVIFAFVLIALAN